MCSLTTYPAHHILLGLTSRNLLTVQVPGSLYLRCGSPRWTPYTTTGKMQCSGMNGSKHYTNSACSYFPHESHFELPLSFPNIWTSPHCERMTWARILVTRLQLSFALSAFAYKLASVEFVSFVSCFYVIFPAQTNSWCTPFNFCPTVDLPPNSIF
jgi:hypothetical protein